LPRLLAVPSQEEILMLFSSGRVGTCPATQIPALESGGTWSWEQASLPDEPHVGELLAALMPLAILPLSDYFVQVSRRGCVKKTMTSLAETILSNHFLGRGTSQKADQPFEVLLCRKKARLVLVTYEGRVLGLDVDDLTYSAEDRIRLEPHDHIVAAFVVEPDESLLCLAQNGKVIQREMDIAEPAKSGSARGQALISPSRLDQGTRFIGAAAVRETDRALVLDTQGRLTLHGCRDLTGAGALPTEAQVLAFNVVRGGEAGKCSVSSARCGVPRCRPSRPEFSKSRPEKQPARPKSSQSLSVLTTAGSGPKPSRKCSTWPQP
jgi:DNA gyrase/topoisomerase IV subunit A